MPKTIYFNKVKGDVQQMSWIYRQLDMVLNALREGEYTLTVEKKKQKRTIPQNKTFWLWMACIESNTGTTKEDCHDYYCSLFLRRHVTINGREKEVISGTSGLTTVQFADFLTKIQVDAATELGITLPDPEAAYWEEFERYYRQFI
jgi:hypothetical protein